MESTFNANQEQKEEQSVGTFSGLGNPFKLAFEQSQHVQCIINLEGRILSANQKALSLARPEHQKELTGKRIWHAPWWRSKQNVMINDLFRRAAAGQSIERNLVIGAQGDIPQAYSLNFIPIKNVLGNVSAVLFEAHKQDDNKKSNQEASQDALTGLADATYLLDALTDIVHTSNHDPSHSFAVVSIAIDSLKNITDLFGQTIGDNFITNVARKFRSNTRDHDVVARIDEGAFVIILDHLQVSQNALDFAERCLNFLQADFKVGKAQISIDANVGIAFGDGGQDAQSLLQEAQEALRQAQANPDKSTFVSGMDQLE